MFYFLFARFVSLLLAKIIKLIKHEVNDMIES
jgi:hypothetical protein